MKSDSAQGVKVAVAQGLGVGLLYRSHVEQEIRRGELKVLNVPGLKTHIQSFIIDKAGKLLSPAAQAFLELLRQSRDNPKNNKKIPARSPTVLSAKENKVEGESVGDQK
jgi:DNA-binding transcriptional LysR family regulator